MNPMDHASRLAAAQTVTEALRFDPVHPDTIRLTRAIATLLGNGNPPETTDPGCTGPIPSNTSTTRDSGDGLGFTPPKA